MNIDENKFINVTDPLYAYILGLIWADGNVDKKYNGVRFYTTYPDADYFKCVFSKSGKWKEYTYKRRKNWKTSCNLYITNGGLKKFLFEMNYCSKNDSADNILSHIPTHLQSDWMLGLIDGDGHIAVDSKNGLYEIQIAGPVNQNWTFLEKYCQALTCDYTIQHTKNKKVRGSIVRIVGRRNVYNFGESIWKQKNLHLPAHPAYISVPSPQSESEHFWPVPGKLCPWRWEPCLWVFF